MKKFPIILLALIILGIASINLYAKPKLVPANLNNSGEYAVAAYVQKDYNDLPKDPSMMTHIFYCFAEIAETFDSLEIQNPNKLREIVKLKEINPNLKVLISVSGYRKKGYSEMASSSKLRKAFAKDCKKKIKEFNLDGIDLDWEFPTTTAGGHTARPDDDKNYGKLAKDLRKALGKDKIITFYSNNSAAWIDFPAMLPYVDYVMVSGYNLGMPPKHQSNLYSSEACGDWSVAKSVARHIAKGVPPNKILLGIPLFARTIPLESTRSKADYIEPNTFEKYLGGFQEIWDDEAKVPYRANKEGKLVAAYDNEKSFQEKADFIKKNGLSGVFYFHYAADDSTHSRAQKIKQLFLDN